MSKYCYLTAITDSDGNIIGSKEVIVHHDDIIREYFPIWSRREGMKYGVNHPYINHENCIKDWIMEMYAFKLGEMVTNED